MSLALLIGWLFLSHGHHGGGDFWFLGGRTPHAMRARSPRSCPTKRCRTPPTRLRADSCFHFGFQPSRTQEHLSSLNGSAICPKKTVLGDGGLRWVQIDED
jgi:hypothetical protein